MVKKFFVYLLQLMQRWLLPLGVALLCFEAIWIYQLAQSEARKPTLNMQGVRYLISYLSDYQKDEKFFSEVNVSDDILNLTPLGLEIQSGLEVGSSLGTVVTSSLSKLGRFPAGAELYEFTDASF